MPKSLGNSRILYYTLIVNLISIESYAMQYGNCYSKESSCHCHNIHSLPINKLSDKRIIIIGAGIAGLGAAKLLHQNGYDNLIILEAQNRIGGRIYTFPFGDGIIELGAQWVHGQGDNPIYQLGLEYDLLADPETDSSEEGAGIFATEDGVILDKEKIENVKQILENIKENITPEDGFDKNGNVVSAGEVFERRYKQFMLDNPNYLGLSDTILFAVYDWVMRYEIADWASTRVNDIYDVSVHPYTSQVEYGGSYTVNWKNGYSTLINRIVSELPKNSININQLVQYIEIFNDPKVPLVQLTLSGERYPIIADHVIVTSSIGYLKKHYKTLFDYIPPNKAKAIETLGFGAISKMFLEFKEPFWSKDIKGFQLYWTIPDSGKFPLWTRSISGFDTVRNQPNVLLGWIGGSGALTAEEKDDNEVINTLTDLLRSFFPNLNVTVPIRIIRSKWGHHSLTLGTYSHNSADFARTGLSKRELFDPLLCGKKNIPCVLFAGEGTDEYSYSATHGALKSGRREAQRIIDFWKNDKFCY